VLCSVSSMARTADHASTLHAGVRVFRWAALAWMTFSAIVWGRPFHRPWLAWSAIGVAGAWTVWLTASGREERRAALWADLGLGCALMVVSGLVVERGAIVTQPFFATAYPFAAAALWGTARGPWAGAAA